MLAGHPEPPTSTILDADLVNDIRNVLKDDAKSLQSMTLKSKRKSHASLTEQHELDGMTEAELKARLKEVLEDLRNKEADLTMAAEIGTQLVAANNTLMNQYQDLVDRLRAAEGQHRQAMMGHTTSSQAAMRLIDSLNGPSLPAPAPAAQIEYSSSPKENVLPPPSRPLSPLHKPKFSTSPTSPTSPTQASALTRQSTDHLHQLISDLESANTSLRSQIESSHTTLREAEHNHAKIVSSLRKTNAELQEDLHKTLRSLRDAEHAHTRSIRALEEQVDRLRHDLDIASKAAEELDAERRKLIRERMESQKDAREMETLDSETIRLLHNRVKTLEAERTRLELARRDSERKYQIQNTDLESLRSRVVELEAREEETYQLKDEFSRQYQLIEELREQLEGERKRAVEEKEERDFWNCGGLGGILPGKGVTGIPGYGEVFGDDDRALIYLERGDDWQWSKWLERARTRMWERDVSGLRSEVRTFDYRLFRGATSRFTVDARHCQCSESVHIVPISHVPTPTPNRSKTSKPTAKKPTSASETPSTNSPSKSRNTSPVPSPSLQKHLWTSYRLRLLI
ncbi:hypothetical protein HDV00_010841 [Rhizophlyctis rosea]|nr:hypothetical protein HDV00_010841 [Rhizophlyctis rosea]